MYNGYERYVEDVLSGRQVAGKYVKLACQRYLDFRDKYEFREDKVNKVIDFIAHTKHTAGKFKGKPFILEPWQEFVVANIFGFYDGDTRVTQSVFIECARKVGKTQFIAAIALYCLVADGESMAEVPILANSAQQAAILLNMSKLLIGYLDPKHKHFTRLRDVIKYPKTNSSMYIKASDSSNLDGLNPYVFVLDEVHEYKDSRIYDVMVSGQGMRENPMGIQITTAGFDITGYCYGVRKTCVNILKGLADDDSQFSMIFELDKDDDWEDDRVWVKANPNLDVTVTKAWMHKHLNKAKNNPDLLRSFKVKNLNIWQASSVNQWIDNQIIEDATQKVPWDIFNDGNTITWAGIDLSSVSDLTCATYMAKKENVYYFKTQYYLPEATLNDPNNGEKYRKWNREGYLTLTPGNVCDYDYILNDILTTQQGGVTLDTISYDSYNATQFAINATSAGLPMKPYAQALYNFNRPTKEFERLIKQGRVVLDYNPITQWCFSNAVLKTDWNGNVKPIKNDGQNVASSNKIDGVITIVESLGGYLESDTAKYEGSDMSV